MNRDSLAGMDGRILLAAAIVFATLVGAWMFRFEPNSSGFGTHRNRFTGAICFDRDECWFSNGPDFK